MRLLKAAILDSIYFFTFPFVTFAHEAEVLHEEPVPTISPVLLVGVVGVLAVGGFVLWRFVLRGSSTFTPTQSTPPEQKPPAQEKIVSKNNQSDNSQKNG